MTKEMIEENKNVIIIGIGILVIVGTLFFVSFGDTSEGVTRLFSATEVSPEGTFSVSYNVVLDSGQRYYLLEDQVPDGFEILDCVHSPNNKIKIFDIETAQSRVLNCAIKASSTPGTYTFSGEYSFEGLENPVTIE